jgi:membrane protease YdiL (CAAX protease family)
MPTDMRRIILEILLISSLFFPLPLFFLPDLQTNAPAITSQMVGYISGSVPQILVLLYIIFLQHEPLERYGVKRPGRATFGWMGVSLAAALAVMIAVMSIYSLLPQAVRDNLLKEQPIAVSSYAELPLTALFCLAVGYREELFFRAYLMTRLGELGIKPVWTILGTSVIFGMAHFNQGLLGVLTTGGIGLIFAAVFNARKDLHTVAGAHALYNFTLFLFSFMGKEFHF